MPKRGYFYYVISPISQMRELRLRDVTDHRLARRQCPNGATHSAGWNTSSCSSLPSQAMGEEEQR